MHTGLRHKHTYVSLQYVSLAYLFQHGSHATFMPLRRHCLAQVGSELLRSNATPKIFKAPAYWYHTNLYRIVVTTGILTIPGILPLTGSIIYLSCENITTLVAELTLRRSVYRWTTRPLTGGYVIRRYRGRKSLTGISSSVSSASAWSTSSRAHTHTLLHSS